LNLLFNKAIDENIEKIFLPESFYKILTKEKTPNRKHGFCKSGGSMLRINSCDENRHLRQVRNRCA